ncbi:MAG TPA: protein translocase subunit SecD, partial [Thiomicrospira sp.]|nr:protein translocase subunit SecD [Thiomicrospira sp.]
MFQAQQKVMTNQYPAWKYLLLIVITVIGLTYAMPNLFGDDPAVQISPAKSVVFNADTQVKVEGLLEKAGLEVKSSVFEGGKFLIRFD